MNYCGTPKKILQRKAGKDLIAKIRNNEPSMRKSQFGNIDAQEQGEEIDGQGRYEKDLNL